MSKTVAIVGASSDRRKFGNKALRAFEHAGHTVVAINPNETEVEGHRCFPSLRDVPGVVDMATFYVPADVGERLLDDVVAKDVPELWINPGAESPGLIARARTLGLSPVLDCSIVGIGENPSNY